MRVLITGTPGVGKTTFAKKLSEIYSIPHIDVTACIKENGLYKKYDSHFDTLVFSPSRVRKHLATALDGHKSVLLDTHSPCVAAKLNINLIFHLRCSPKTLRERLELRGYSEHKISENLDCECLDSVGLELEEYFNIDSIYIVRSEEGEIEEDEISLDDAIEMVRELIWECSKE